jgi:hypothetical protein
MSRPDDESRHLLTLDRTKVGGSEEEVRIALDTFNGNPYVSIRLWFRNRAGAWMPTRRGCSVRLREIGDVVSALQSAERICDSQRPRQPRREPDRRRPNLPGVSAGGEGFSEFDE